MLGQVLAQVLAFDLESMSGLTLGRTFDHGGQGRLDVEVADTEGVGVGNDGVG